MLLAESCSALYKCSKVVMGYLEKVGLTDLVRVRRCEVLCYGSLAERFYV